MMAHHVSGRLLRIAVVAVVLVAGFAASASARADALLDEMVAFTAQIFIIDTKVPAVVIGAVRDGETSVAGFGERAGPGSPAPDGDTILRIGSITKAFTGDVLAHLVAKGTVGLSDPLTKWAPDLGPGVNGDLERVTLLNLATHSGGFPREVPHEAGPDNDPFATITPDAFAAWIKKEPLLFAPGSAVHYSNFGFDLLAMALSAAGKKPYPDLLLENVTGPLQMKDTGFTLTDEQKKRFMPGHAPDGTELPDRPDRLGHRRLRRPLFDAQRSAQMDEVASRSLQPRRRRGARCSTTRSISTATG